MKRSNMENNFLIGKTLEIHGINHEILSVGPLNQKGCYNVITKFQISEELMNTLHEQEKENSNGK